MSLFLGTLILTLASCLAMALGLLLRGRPLSGGCGAAKAGSVRCAGCPRRGRSDATPCARKGEG
jgi:hypothetical protein